MPGPVLRAHRTRFVRSARSACLARRTRRVRHYGALFALFAFALVAWPGVFRLGLPAPAHADTAQGGVQQACLRFEGEKVWLRGVLELVNFPGPPNYRSIHRGDRPVPEFVVALEAPLCLLPEASPQAQAEQARAGPADPAPSPHAGESAAQHAGAPGAPLQVRRMQALPADAPVEVAALGNLGEAVWLYGSLQRPASKRHQLPVLLNLVRVSAGPGIAPPGAPEAPVAVPGLPPAPAP